MITAVTHTRFTSYREIEKWFKAGNKTSPVTNLPLESTSLITNLALRGTIAEWREKQGAELLVQWRSSRRDI